jgi:hypothetical protein
MGPLDQASCEALEGAVFQAFRGDGDADPSAVRAGYRQDARNAGSSGPSSNENKTCIISFVLILPLASLSTTTRFWASGSPTGTTILAPDLS